MGKGERRHTGVVVAITLTSACATVWASDVVLDGVAAMVGTSVVMRSDVRLAQDLGLVPATVNESQAVEQLIDRTLMVAEVDRFQPPAPLETVVDARYAELRAKVGKDAWDRALRRAGVDNQYVRALVRDQLRVDAYLRQRFGTLATPSDEDLRQAYDERRSPLLQVTVVPPFDAVKDRLRDEMTREKFDALVGDWVRELRARGDVRVSSPPPSRPPRTDG